jgi:regulator of RNase E activity RraA
LINPNFDIGPVPKLAPEELTRALRSVVTPHISDNLRRMSGIVGLQRFSRSRKLVGTAYTIKARPGDNLLIYRALKEIEPGHVLVIDGGGDPNNALVGELIMLYALQRGCAGFVIDGAIRDVRAFFDADFPCYARSSTHRGPYKIGPGASNRDVTVGGQVVHPGDVVVGDEDGVVSFDPADGERLLAAIAQTAKTEDAIKAEIATGRVDQSWLDKTLSAHGF